MTVTVTPEAFALVLFDTERIRAVVEGVARGLGLSDAVPIVVNVDESTPLARTTLSSIDPPVLDIEGGAFEHPRLPRQLSETRVAIVAARLLARAADRSDPGFAEAPGEDQLTLPQADAWDAYALGRASRLGYTVHEPRWRYRFRTRHGFTDTADKVFDRLWAAEHLTWADLVAACEETSRARTSAA